VTHDRSAVSPRTQAEIQVVVFTFFLFESDVFYCTGKRELAIVCEGFCSGPLATGVKLLLGYVYLFQFLPQDSYCFFGWGFGYTFPSVVAPLFSPKICWFFTPPPPLCLYFRFYCFLSLFFRRSVFPDILCSLFNCFLLLFISLSSQQLLKYYARNCAVIIPNSCMISAFRRQVDEICTLLRDYGA
jgi:hypothetical protein